MTFKVGDFVALGGNDMLGEGKVYGIVTKIDNIKDYVQVFWLDGYGYSEEYIKNESLVILEEPNEIPSR